MTYKQWLLRELKIMFSKEEISKPIHEGVLPPAILIVGILFLVVNLSLWFLFLLLIPTFVLTHALYRDKCRSNNSSTLLMMIGEIAIHRTAKWHKEK